MSVRVDSQLLQGEARLVAAPNRRACEDHSFELPTGLYVAMAGLLFGFLAVLAIGLSSPGLVVPMAINFVFLTAFFAVPTIFVRTTSDSSRASTWAHFMDRGIETATGHSSGKEAAVLMLLLPAFIFCWALAIVVIAALV
ncbi:MAG TPA: hypothetical protein VFO42_06995 [Sphingomicrobium sp.]|nr:hypothetical protein [Sphingomicrobium sp.]